MVILLVVLVIFLVLLAGMLLAFLFSRLDKTVVTTRATMVAEERMYNPAVTLGHKIKVDADYEDQLKQARVEAARKAASLPRGANSRIGRAGHSTLSTAGRNTQNDPLTAVRIARFHGWDGARTGIPAGGVPAGGLAPAVSAAPAAAGTASAAPAGIAPPTLIPITPDMPPEEVRKARIANSKAEAAYNKALKAAASGAPAPAVAGAPAAAATVAVAPAPVAVGIEPPKLIEITDGMSPEDVRKARIANAKAEAAYNKALKAAGVSAGAPAAQPAAQAVAAPVAPAPQPVAPVAVGIEPPTLIEITDNMPPEEVRRARVANAKAESAYNKALKAAGIDPAAMKTSGQPAVAQAAAPAAVAEVAAQSAPVPASAAPAAPAVPAGIEQPTLIEITDNMPPEEIRRARVENAKAMAAYNKALKAAGIDPASLK
jgi:hypothetical protein